VTSTQVGTPVRVGWDRTAQPHASSALQSAITRDELGHAFLLVGPGGVGQRELAQALAAALNCPDPVDGTPCGTCETCARIARETHTALVTFEPEGAQHLVSSVREDWIPTASRTLTEGRRRVIRIVAADRMNESAQNAFLKALEEPPPSTIWVLETTDDTSLLDTILSRCRRLDLVTWPPDALRERARELGIPEDRVDASVRAATGSPDRLADLAARECPECGRVHVVGTDGRAATQCWHHRLDCTACGKSGIKGPPKLGGGRKPPCDCGKDVFDPSTLVGVSTVPEQARDRHVAVVRRLADRGPGEVTAAVKDVTEWARQCAAGLADAHEAEIQQLFEDYGATSDRDLPRGVLARMKRRHKRLQRETSQAAIHRFLDEFGAYVRDLLVVHGGGGGDQLVHLDHAADARADAPRLPPPACLRTLADLNRCRNAITEFNGQPELQLERVLHPVAAAVFATGRR
jgi:hypothetical protein